MFPHHLVDAATALLSTCREKGLKLATAESCTGGLIGALLTAIPGSSDVYERGFITYSNAAKHDLLGVDDGTLRQFGAVSAEVAAQMAAGARRHSRADIAVAVTGIAGPGGGSAEKPVGLVWFGIAAGDGATRTAHERFGDLGRDQVRLASLATALGLLTRAAAQAGRP